jgi:hypothetical protein
VKHRIISSAVVALTLAVSALVATPEGPAATSVTPPAAPRTRTSPHETVGLKLGNNRVTIIYGRPYSKDPKAGSPRKIWGALVPTGKVWRTGADEATLLLTQQAIELGGVKLPAGAYSLYTLLNEDGSATLLVNRRIGQWGADPYDPSTEFARVTLRKDTLSTPVDQFTMALEKAPEGGGVLKLAWETTQYSAPFTAAK